MLTHWPAAWRVWKYWAVIIDSAQVIAGARPSPDCQIIWQINRMLTCAGIPFPDLSKLSEVHAHFDY